MTRPKPFARRCPVPLLAIWLLEGGQTLHAPASGESQAPSRLLRIETIREAISDDERPRLGHYQASSPAEFEGISDFHRIPEILPPDLAAEYRVLLAAHEEAVQDQRVATAQLLEDVHRRRPMSLMAWLKKTAFPEVRRLRPWAGLLGKHQDYSSEVVEAPEDESLVDGSDGSAGREQASSELRARLSEANRWTNRFFIASFLIGFLTLQATSVLRVTTRESTSPGAAYARKGSTVTLLVASSLAMLLCAVTFTAVLVFSEARNRMAHDEATAKGIPLDQVILDSPGERAFEAGEGVVLSVAVAALLTCLWRKSGEVDVQSSLLVHFALRGAIFSTVIALGMEILGQIILDKSLGPTDDKDLSPAAVVPLMIIVGVSEEAAKTGAIIYGVFLSEYALARAGSRGCCSCCRSLLTQPRALMLAGLSVGFGFMIVENAGYLVVSSLENAHDLEQERVSNPARHGAAFNLLSFHRGDPSSGKAHSDEEVMDPDVLRVLRIMVICFRVLLNLHPWLTGLTAARIANSVFKEYRERASLSPSEFLRCCAPAAIIHALYDSGITIMPVTVALAVPLVCWSCTKALFREEWQVAIVASRRQAEPPPISNEVDDVFLLEPITIQPKSKAKAKPSPQNDRRGSAQQTLSEDSVVGTSLAASPAAKPAPARPSITTPALAA